MSITSSELIIYGSQNIAENETDTQGGAIDTTVRYVFNSLLVSGLNSTVSVSSSSSSDTAQDVVINGILSSGLEVNETINLDGTNPLTSSNTFYRINKITISNSHVGTITIRSVSDSTVLAQIESGVLEIRNLFLNAYSEESGGSGLYYYEKIFCKNTNSTLTLTEAKVIEEDDSGNFIQFALANSLNDTGSVSNRHTAPTLSDSFDSADRNLPDSILPAGSAIGIWVRLYLPAGTVASSRTYTLRLSGKTI